MEAIEWKNPRTSYILFLVLLGVFVADWGSCYGEEFRITICDLLVVALAAYSFRSNTWLISLMLVDAVFIIWRFLI